MAVELQCTALQRLRYDMHFADSQSKGLAQHGPARRGIGNALERMAKALYCLAWQRKGYERRCDGYALNRIALDLHWIDWQRRRYAVHRKAKAKLGTALLGI